MKILFLFPVTIFRDIKFSGYDKIIIVEDPRYFTDFEYHKMKLLFHRMSLKNYAEYIKKKCKVPLMYVNFYDVTAAFYKEQKKYECFAYDCYDVLLEEKINKLIPNFTWLPSKNFLMTREEMRTNKYKRQGAFYKQQREKTGILMTTTGKPYGGKFSFDEENRKKLEPAKIEDLQNEVEYYYEDLPATKYINKYFAKNYGDCDVCYYPVTFDESLAELREFIDTRLLNFTFQDAIIDNNSTFPCARVYHSCISAMLNVGLLTDTIIIEELKPVFDVLRKKFNSTTLPDKVSGKQYYTLLYSTEGFLRQVLGWRHYMMGIYLREKDLRNSNHMKYTKKLPFDKYWQGTTGILPIDNCINKVRRYAYLHHIERLMILGNFMFMKGYTPKDVYTIFMCWTIDAYDWVMVSNIFTMSQFSSSTSYTTKPYYASSNYILRMSNYKKGEWCKKWDEVYHEFLKDNAWVKKYNRF